MRQNDDSRAPPSDSLTPSGWHNDAYGRDASHDEMQAAWWRFIPYASESSIRRKAYLTESDYAYVGTWVEYPFTIAGRLIGFADVGVLYQSEEADGNNHYRRFWKFYEIKPVIYSVGALIRQVKATKILAERADLTCEVSAVVTSTDPKLDLLCELACFPICTMPPPRGRPQP